MNLYQYVPMLYRASFESYAAAMASVGAADDEIASALSGAKAAGETVITLRPPAAEGQLEPMFRIQPGEEGVSLWVGDQGYATETLEEAAAFIAKTNPGVPWFALLVLAPTPGGRPC